MREPELSPKKSTVLHSNRYIKNLFFYTISRIKIKKEKEDKRKGNTNGRLKIEYQDTKFVQSSKKSKSKYQKNYKI